MYFNFLQDSESLTCPHREVHKAVQSRSGKVVALKRILMHNEKEGMPVTALREIKILKALHHPCVVNILDMFVVRSEFVLFCYWLCLLMGIRMLR
jgi:serine/threonine protein kinase